MLIRIMYADGRFDLIKSFFLDWLIESGRIAMFRRSDGWIVLGRDPVRSPQRNPYMGRERRGEMEPPLIAVLASLAAKESENRKTGE